MVPYTPDAKVLEAFFLETAALTYAGGTIEKGTIVELPGSKVYRYERDNLLYLDAYWVNGEFSGGKTLLYDLDYSTTKPVWMMDYDGWCMNDDREVLSFLKRALSAAYGAGKFVGGRGLTTFFEDVPDKRGEVGLVYWNQPDRDHSGFTYFQGREKIFRWPQQRPELFWHRYKGLLLFGDVEENMKPTFRDDV